MRFSRRWFREIPGVPGYWINKRGQIYSKKTRRFLKWHFNSKYYWRVCVYVDRRPVRFLVHRLVAIIFVENPDPINKIEVNHLDYDTTNPHYLNLQWVTAQENREHKRRKSWREDDKKYIVNVESCPF